MPGYPCCCGPQPEPSLCAIDAPPLNQVTAHINVAWRDLGCGGDGRDDGFSGPGPCSNLDYNGPTIPGFLDADGYLSTDTLPDSNPPYHIGRFAYCLEVGGNAGGRTIDKYLTKLICIPVGAIGFPQGGFGIKIRFVGFTFQQQDLIFGESQYQGAGPIRGVSYSVDIYPEIAALTQIWAGCLPSAVAVAFTW